MGCAEGPDAGPVGASDGGARRGPPDGVRRLRGEIPQGEYGGGDVIVWDRGTWEPHDTDDPAAAVVQGELHADMHGQKLTGRLVLVRTDRRTDDGADKDQWLLPHKHDVDDLEDFDHLGNDELAALDDLAREGVWSVFGRDLRVTNLDKLSSVSRRYITS